ncbi:BTAD domain-containing putative transcriptional regulator [Streptomyces roseicoloratus]|uniref:BTAD domain-containing putative transcriptional regulator n=1 Tax=Streptomyces roseicoloratus TaxID=2508722 RepID=UPI001009E997|nr:BTAD domain-containing putative transcriptional regulator [Streptomyces roseicoloratus]
MQSPPPTSPRPPSFPEPPSSTRPPSSPEPWSSPQPPSPDQRASSDQQAAPDQQASPPYRVLGPARARRGDGGRAALNGARLRALLTALAAAGGRTVRTDALIAQVWADDADEDRVEALQALVGRLRRALGRDAVASAPGGYRLAAGPEDIDVFRFERLADEGVRELDAGRPGPAAALLDEALGLWHGPALADLPGHGTDPLAVRAEARRDRARRDRLAADIALGRAQDALAPLAALTAEHPLDEPLHALRLRALRAAGRPAEALEAYETVRRALADRLGTEPGPELKTLYEELLEGKAADERAAPAWRPVAAPPTSFLGRETELRDLEQWLTAEDTRLVTLTGPGGVGKTRLALEVASVRAGGGRGDAARGEEVRVAELAAVREESDVAAAVLTAVEARETAVWSGSALPDAGSRDPLSVLVEHCARRRMLLVLDNCEHVVGAAAGLTAALLARCPGVTVLATSREPLGVPGEALCPLDPLADAPAVRLLGERGAAARPGFDVAEDPEAAAEIVRRLDGLPLAIELAAARLRLLTARQIADRLDDRFRLLTSGARTVLPRQQTLRAVVDWSWDLLDEDERTVLRRLSVFRGGCDLEAAEAVCAEPDGARGVPGAARDTPGAAVASPGAAEGAGPTGPSPDDVLDLLGSLVDKSLVVAAPGGGAGAGPGSGPGMRYRLLETVAEYAGRRLDEAGDREATERRHLTHYREVARRTDPELRGPRQEFAMLRLEAEHDNVRGALRTAVRLRSEQDALCLVHAMSWFWQLRNHQHDALTWTRAAMVLGPDPFAEPVRAAGPFEGRCGDVPPPWSGERLWEARRGGRLLALATEGGGGATAAEQDGTRAVLEAVVSAYRPGLPQNCRHPGTMWFFARLMTGRFADLDETLAALVAATREHGDGWDLAFALLLRARLLGGQERDAEEVLARFEATGDSWGIAEALAARGETYERAGRTAEAAADFARAMDAVARLGARSQVPVFKALLAAVRLRTPEVAEDPAKRADAERMLEEAAEESGATGVEAVSTARLLLAQHYGNTGRTALAREQLHLMQADFSELTPGLFLGMLDGLGGWLDCLDGAFEAAGARLARGVREMETLAFLVAPYLVVTQFATAAWARAGSGAAEEGARLLGAYDAHRGGPAGAGIRPLTPHTEAAVRARAEEAVRAALDPRTFGTHYERGRALTPHEAAALVRG